MFQAFLRLICVLALASVLGGCASSSDVAPPPSSPLGKNLPTFVVSENPEGDTARAKSLEDPADDLNLRDALVLALRNNPSLAAFSWEVRVRDAEALQAGLAPNPDLGLQVENFAGSDELRGFHGAETTISLSQLIELGGKRGRRQTVSLLDRNLAGWDYEVARLDVLTEVTKAFVAILAAQEKTGLAEELVRVADQAAANVSRRVQAGGVSPVEGTRARVEAATSRLDMRIADRNLAAERKRLAALWGSSSPRFTRAVGDLDGAAPPPALADLLTRIESNPDIGRWATELERRRADVTLQKSLGVPDLEVGGGFRHLAESSDNALVMGLAIPLPFFNSNQGAQRAARARVTQGEELKRRAVAAVGSALAITYETLDASREEIAALEGEILPEAETALEQAQDAYGKGLFRLTDVLDTQRKVFELRGRRFDALVTYRQSVADIERLIGEPLTGGTDDKE
jgi:outer membrane protein, heavy metal efflux system